MHFPRSIRWRLQLWYGVLLVAMLAGFGTTAFQLEKARRFRRIDAELQTRLSVLVDALRTNRDGGADRSRSPQPHFRPGQAGLFGDGEGHYFAVWMQGPAPTAGSPNVPAGIPKPEAAATLIRTRGNLREAFIFSAPVNCVLVGRSVAADEADLRTLALTLGLAGGGILVIALVIGSLIIGQALRPVTEISNTAAKIAAGDLSQRIATAETDSELGQLAAVLNSTYSRLESAFAQQARFTADAAHELRTPVAVMLTQIQSALMRERSAEEYRETIEACQRAVQRMRRLTESLLELARLDAGQEALRRSPCDLAQIARECHLQLQPLADAKGIAIATELAPCPLTGDAERLAQVVTNLLGNAIEYNREGGTIRLHTIPEVGRVRLKISDSGPGIPEEDLPLIFARFHRADRARTPGHSGLGLAISQAIVEAHGGTISGDNNSGPGATFTVELPT